MGGWFNAALSHSTLPVMGHVFGVTYGWADARIGMDDTTYGRG